MTTAPSAVARPPANGEPEAVLRVADVVKDYPSRKTTLAALWNRSERVRALDGVTITLRRGETVALLGPNGSGKSTLLRLAGALLTPTRGVVEVAGVPADRRSQARHRVGYADGTGFQPRLSGRENLRLAAALYEIESSDNRIGEVAALVGMEGLLDARVQTLSTGEKARMTLARSLMHRPALLLIDELFNALDPGAAERLRSQIGDLAKRNGVAALVATHDLALARSLSRCVVLDHGRIAADGAFDEIVPTAVKLFGISHA
jgi:ABC-type multidrug transport system ATPase subunit